VSTPEANDVRESLLNSALAVAAAGGWPSASLAAVAKDAGVSLADAYAHFPTRLSILAGLLARTDRKVLADGPAESDDAPRDRLFEILMRRFDALAADRDGMRAIVRDMPGDPLNALLLAPCFAASMAWMLEAAGLPATGVGGSLRVKGLAIVYLATLRTWLDDDSIDMAKTMATLDRNLQRADSLARRLPLRSRHRPVGDVAPPSAPPESPGSPSEPSPSPSPAGG
jgi:AcrR family transcriptional regulator